MSGSGKDLRKGFLRIIFGRTGFIAISIIAQFLIILAYFNYLNEYSEAVTFFLYLLSFVILVHILNRDENPSYKIAWLLPVAIFPVFGALLFLFFHLQPTVALTNKRLQSNSQKVSECLNQDKAILEQYENAGGSKGIVKYMNTFGGYPICNNTDVTYFPLGDDMYPALLDELKKAEKFIFMEFFIIDSGEMWNGILDILKQKAQQGVEIRLMYDGLCSVALLPYSYPKQLEKMGIQCRIFNPIRPFLSSSQNNRDHRKICVIDGVVGFTGGVNIADEYINCIERFGHWKDTAVMLKGSGVNNLTMMFLQMWNIMPPEEDYTKYTVAMPEIKADGFVLPYGDSPLDNEPVGKLIYLNILNTAKRYVHITTPYLILDHEMETALTFAAKRGIDVKLILPHKPDKKYAFYLAHAHYEKLLKAGVKIYEYTPGFVHAKNYVSDDTKAIVGTINMDFRSLYLHWECACYMYKTACVADIENDFSDTLKKCQQITLEDVKKFSVFEKVVGSILKILAPLM